MTLLPLANLTAVLATPLTIWQQTYGLVAGFANHVISEVTLFLLCLVVFRREEIGRTARAKWLLFLYAAACQFFLENITVFVFC